MDQVDDGLTNRSIVVNEGWCVSCVVRIRIKLASNRGRQQCSRQHFCLRRNFYWTTHGPLLPYDEEF